MTNHQKGYRRDRLVLNTIAEWGTMDTDQLRILFYPSTRVAQRRLRILVKKGKLKRFREAIEIPYYYYVKNYDTIRVSVNWARLWLIKRLKSWEVIEAFDYETYTATVRNTAINAVKIYTILYNAMRRTWLNDNVILIYETEEQKREAAKRLKGLLLTIEEIREGLK